jgi:hypothetical protein
MPRRSAFELTSWTKYERAATTGSPLIASAPETASEARSTTREA